MAATLEEQIEGAAEPRGIVEHRTGLVLYDLTHPWGFNTPAYPGFEDVIITRTVTHAQHGVLTQRYRTVMHSGTHLNAPLHLIPGAPGVGDIPLRTFFGTGVVLSIAKAEWELITAADLEAHGAAVRDGDIVVINTGWHRGYSDSASYFGHAPGLALDGADWLVERGVKLLGMDTPFIDHPLATAMGLQRGGPLMRRLPAAYQAATGIDPRVAFPEKQPAHRRLLAAAIPTIENVGGEIDAVTGVRSTFHAYPWRWPEGDACGIRLVAIHDPDGRYRFSPDGSGAAS